MIKKKVQAQTLYNISHLSPRQHNHGSRAFRSNPRNKRKNTHVPPTSTQELYSGTELPSQFAKRVTCCSADINSRSSVEALQGIKHVLHQACVSHLDASFCFHIYLTQGALTFLGIISSRTPKWQSISFYLPSYHCNIAPNFSKILAATSHYILIWNS